MISLSYALLNNEMRSGQLTTLRDNVRRTVYQVYEFDLDVKHIRPRYRPGI